MFCLPNPLQKYLKRRMMEDITVRLQQIEPVITKICEISGTPGASIGVLHHNRLVHRSGFGFRDVEKQLPVDENTLYHIASLSKSFTGAAINILAHNNQLKLDVPVEQILPEYTHENPAVKSEATLLDHLSHRTGLAQKSAIWLQDGADLLLGPEELFPTFSYTESMYPLRSQWFYSNWGYCVAAAAIEKVSGSTWGEFLTKRLFEPLGLTSTTMQRYPDNENVARAYQARLDSSPSSVEPPPLVAGSIMQGSAGVVSSVMIF